MIATIYVVTQLRIFTVNKEYKWQNNPYKSML